MISKKWDPWNEYGLKAPWMSEYAEYVFSDNPYPAIQPSIMVPV